MMNLSTGTKLLMIGLVLVFLIPMWGMLRFFIGTMTLPRPPKPEITREEFNFRLEYEIEGERVVIEDKFIVLFDGFSGDTGAMSWYRRWRLHLASDRRAEHVLLLQLDDGRRIYYDVGSPNYYMGDLDREIEPGRWYPFNGVFYVESKRDTSIGNRKFIDGPEGLYKDFGIRLISWEHDPPIENSFE